MKKFTATIGGLVLAATLATTATSESHADAAVLAAVKARQAQMTLYAFNIGLLGGMAKGQIAYDAEAAGKAAGNLATLTKTDQSRMWPPGSDNFELGEAATRALPDIWNEGSDIGKKAMALSDAVAAMEAAAGGGLDQLKAAIGPLGAACGSCHKAYRQPEN